MVNATDPDLRDAARDDLVALIGAQAASITTLTARVAELEAQLGSGAGKAMPGTKPASVTRRQATGKPRRPRPHGYARQRVAPTQQVRHALDCCPHCQTPLTGGWVARRREVIDLPVAPVAVIEHQVIARTCPTCDRVIRPQLDLSGEVVGAQRLSARVVSLIATLREVGRLPVRVIQTLLGSLHGLHLSVGAIVAASARVATAGAAAVTAIRDQVRAAPAVAMDETGWRQNGVNGYVWTVATPTVRYFTHGNRTKAMVDTVLGPDFSGTIGCDFYAAYHHYPGAKQRCWAHLLREVHELTTAFPADAALTRWKEALHCLYRAAGRVTSDPPSDRAQARIQCEQRLSTLCEPVATDPTAVHAKLARRLLRHREELFVFVTDPAVESTNNLAERSLRPLVTARKISGGTRSAAGTATKLAMASLVGTWQLQGRNPLVETRNLLLSPAL